MNQKQANPNRYPVKKIFQDKTKTTLPQGWEKSVLPPVMLKRPANTGINLLSKQCKIWLVVFHAIYIEVSTGVILLLCW